MQKHFAVVTGITMLAVAGVVVFQGTNGNFLKGYVVDEGRESSNVIDARYGVACSNPGNCVAGYVGSCNQTTCLQDYNTGNCVYNENRCFVQTVTCEDESNCQSTYKTCRGSDYLCLKEAGNYSGKGSCCKIYESCFEGICRTAALPCAVAGQMAASLGCCTGFMPGSDGVCWPPCTGSNMGPGCSSSSSANNMCTGAGEIHCGGGVCCSTNDGYCNNGYCMPYMMSSSFSS